MSGLKNLIQQISSIHHLSTPHFAHNCFGHNAHRKLATSVFWGRLLILDGELNNRRETAWNDGPKARRGVNVKLFRIHISCSIVIAHLSSCTANTGRPNHVLEYTFNQGNNNLMESRDYVRNSYTLFQCMYQISRNYRTVLFLKLQNFQILKSQKQSSLPNSSLLDSNFQVDQRTKVSLSRERKWKKPLIKEPVN